MSPKLILLLWLALLCGVNLLLGGCGGPQPFVWREPAVEAVWPPPPDTPRLRYLRSFTGVDDFRSEKKSDSLFRWLLGENREDLPLLTPYAPSVDSRGVLWVADNGARMLYRFDLPRSRVDYIREVGGVRLLSPSGVVTDDAHQRVLVSDTELAKVLVLNPQGELLAQWAPPEGFRRPAGMALDQDGRLYVADVLHRQVFIFDAAGRLLERRGSKLAAGGLFQRPLAVAIGPDGELLILDGGAFRVEVQDARGDLLRTIGKLGDAAGSFARPKGVAVSRQGVVLVTDAAFDNVQLFDLTGQLLMYFGSPGNGVGQFSLPAGLCLDDAGHLFVADSYNHRVQVFEFLPGTH